MNIVSSSAELLEQSRQFAAAGARVAFVPTMGNLHAGHLSLVQRGLEVADVVVVSIFVNPLQFGANEDLDAYPRTLAEDTEQLERVGAHLLFTPSVDVIYPEGMDRHTKVLVPELTGTLCGASRPGHFDGVTTVVCKLLNLVAPQVALFGEKDLQQLLIIQKMVRDLALPIDIEGVPTARADDGLALSSRNNYLNPTQRATAPRLQQELQAIAAAIKSGSRDFEGLCAEAQTRLEAVGFERDYLVVRRRTDLQPAKPLDTELAIFAAAKLGSTRLIDNLQLTVSESTPG